MGSEWRDCIVTMIDLEDVKLRTQAGGAVGSNLMRRFHRLVLKQLRNGLSSIDYAYVWNDSVLLLSFVDAEQRSVEVALRDADRLKRRIDEHAKSYAIAVKGQTFPPVSGGHAEDWPQRVIIIRASSYAMANCFEIEKKVGRTLRKPWYVDGRIATQIRTNRTFQTVKVKLLPSRRPRSVRVYDGYLWADE